MSALPKNLTEVFGVAPFFDLVPKQDLAPLSAINSIHPEKLDLKDYVPVTATHIINDLEANFDETELKIKDLFATFAAKFKAFQEPELECVTFKRPVIAADSDKKATFGKLSSFYDLLRSEDDIIPEGGIQDLDTGLDVSSIAEDGLDIVDNLDDPDVEAHMKRYKEKLQKTREISSKKRSSPGLSNNMKPPKKRVIYDLKTSNVREVDLISVLDSLDLNDLNEMELEQYAKYLVVREGRLAFLRFALGEIRKMHLQSAELDNLDLDQRLKIQKLCANTITTSETSNETELCDSLQASTALLHILNTNTSDRKLHLESFTNSVVAFFELLVDQMQHSEHGFELQKEILECFDALSTQIKYRAFDEHYITKFEYLCTGAMSIKSKNAAFSAMKSVLVDFLVLIFKHYPSQREFIVHEFLHNLKAILSQGTPAAVRLSLGLGVLFTCVFLIRLVQSFELQETELDLGFWMASKGPSSLAVNRLRRFQILELIHSKAEDAKKTAAQVANFVYNSLPVMDTESKQILISLIKDLVTVSLLPGWPGAETLLVAILDKLVTEMTSNNVPQNQEPLVLDLAGIFVVDYLKLKDGEPNFRDPDFHQLFSAHIEVLLHLKNISSLPISRNSEFQSHLIRSIIYFGTLLTDDASQRLENKFLDRKRTPPEDEASITEYVDKLLAILASGKIPEEVSAGSDLGATARKSYRSILMCGSYSGLYDKFVVLLKVSLDSPRAKVTAKAIKVLSRMIEVEPKILLKMKISLSVSRLLKGKSALSRDAVIDLLGEYMFTSEDLIRAYYRSVGDMAEDESILVRKRVTKIMHETYLKTDDSAIKAYAFVTLLKRLDDLDASFANTTRSSMISLFLKSGVKTNTEVMIKALKQSKKSKDSLKSFINYILRRNDPAQKNYKAIKSVVSFIFDEALAAGDDDSIRPASALQLVNLLLQSDSTLVTQDQLTSLQSFLVDSNESDSYYALKTTRLALAKSRIMRPEFLSVTLELLFKRLTKYNLKELHEAVQVINMLTLGTNNPGLAKAAISSMKLLWPQVARSVSDTIGVIKTCKLIQLLGCFGSYCNFQSYLNVFLKSGIGLKLNETIVSLITRYLIYFCLPEKDTKVRACAEKSLICVASHHPQIFLSETVLKILDEELLAGPLHIKHSIVSGLTRYLAKESEYVQNREENVDSERNKNRFLGFELQSVDDSVCAGIVQRYAPYVLELSLLDAGEFGELCVLFVQLVMTLGYANPKVCVPTLLALQASFNARIQKIGAELYEDVFDKHESLADRSYVEGVKLAARYAQSTSELQQMKFLESVYNIIRRTYLARKKFALSIAKLFELKVLARSLQEAVEQRDRTVFLVLNLLHLRFDSFEEVHLLIYHLDRSITKEGIDLSEKITTTIGSKAGDGMSLENLQFLFVYSQSILALIYLRQYFAAAYGIRAAAVEGFRPSRADPELRQEPKAVLLVEFPLASLELGVKLSEPSLFGPIFTRMVQCARDYTT